MTAPVASSLNVLLFASYADAFGARQVQAPVAAPCLVSDVVSALRTLPGGERLPEKPLVAVNRAWSTADTAIKAGDEVALIPPVAGG
jgi:molybdopterin converting factor small subunit